MLKKVEIVDAGDTDFIIGDEVEYSEVVAENKKVSESGGLPSKYIRLLKGITKASLATESFVSAASFQETTRVLTDASVLGKIDKLRGLKENVVIGKLIPAGTGYNPAGNQEDIVSDLETELSDVISETQSELDSQ